MALDTSLEARSVVDSSGVSVDARLEGPVVVEFDGQYVWSFVPTRDGTRRSGVRHTPWPAILLPRLTGSSRVTVRGTGEGPGGGPTYVDQEVVFTDAPDRVRIVDQHGHPVAVDKVGHLQRVFLESSGGIKQEILAGTARALDDLREHCGVAAYLNYGALLGAIRDGAMIAHDSDTDVCYLSSAETPVDIIAESFRIERVLRARGWNLLRMSAGDIKLLLPLSDGRSCHIDVFSAFFVSGRFYQLGNRSGSLSKDAILPLSTITLEGHEFPAPRDPEAMLAFLYGPGWRVPDPSFKYADPIEGVTRLNGWLRGFRTEMGLWNELYQGPAVATIPKGGSEFSAWVRDQIAPGSPVLDIGSGAGSDAVAFHRRGHPVRATDFSRAAVRRVRRRLNRAGAEPQVTRLILNDLRSVLLHASELAHAAQPHELYARHLLGCLDAPARANLWRLAGLSLRRGGSLFLEFASGPAQPDDHPLVRRFDADWLRGELADHGLVVVLEETGPGVDMFGQPDPVVVRMRVEPAARTSTALPAPNEPLPRPRGLRNRLVALDREIQDVRQLHRRLAEVIDVAVELAVPTAHAEPEQVTALHAAYRAAL